MRDHPGDPEWLDTGSPPPSAAQRRRRRIIGVGMLGVAILIAVMFVVAHLNGTDPELGPTPAPALSSLTRGPARPTAPSARPSAARTVHRLRPHLFGDRALTVIAWDRRQVYALDNRSGRVTVTPGTTAGTESYGGSLVAGRDGVVLRPSTDPGGWYIPDGGKPRALSGALATSNKVLPGPDGHVWSVDYGAGGSNAMTLALNRADGTPTRPPLRVEVSGDAVGDGVGGLVFSDPTGVYEVGGAGLKRISRGWLIAAGPHHYLVGDCDQRHACRSYQIDRRSGARRSVPRYEAANGMLSANGRYVALTVWQRNGSVLDKVVDVRTGKVLLRHTQLDPNGDFDTRASWLPDGRLIGLRDGRLFLFDPGSGKLTRPDTGLTGLTQFAVRY